MNRSFSMSMHLWQCCSYQSRHAAYCANGWVTDSSAIKTGPTWRAGLLLTNEAGGRNNTALIPRSRRVSGTNSTGQPASGNGGGP